MSKQIAVKGLEVSYGSVEAVKGIDLDVENGEIVTLIGANGAGKTSTLQAILGLERVKAGRVEYLGETITNQPTHRLVRRGLALVPEGRHVFPRLSVNDNLSLGAYTRSISKAELQRLKEKVFLLFPRLLERKQQMAGTLSGGEQQMLAIGRAMMLSPKVLLLDEPSMGLAPIVVKSIFQTLKRINEEEKLTILLVEQNAKMALGLAGRGYVMENGKIVLQGSTDILAHDPGVMKAYLGL
ncbi:ABC transporter ATP-binding protein [Desulfosporosinus sp. OT]|uniref:ABC transporter ATP-binding protein n=1 Tax=Desulfosporosinus sp. OT TaxID=913865 RepID=UPI000223A193|nr:ABC transporter ATP-binding protein [Desulfosporosinus sp. OT]EGW38503.1 branched chain amino acid ABC transporter, ATP-binding protein [Desulfosporosinus sp. OT]